MRDNIVADRASRIFDDTTEWELNVHILNKITSLLRLQPNIDLFASRLNFQIIPYVSWFADPHALAVDTFTLDSSNYFVYTFPPFSVLLHVLHKIEVDSALAILVQSKIGRRKLGIPSLPNS